MIPFWLSLTQSLYPLCHGSKLLSSTSNIWRRPKRHRPKLWEYNNKDEDNNPNTLNDKKTIHLYLRNFDKSTTEDGEATYLELLIGKNQALLTILPRSRPSLYSFVYWSNKYLKMINILLELFKPYNYEQKILQTIYIYIYIYICVCVCGCVHILKI